MKHATASAFLNVFIRSLPRITLGVHPSSRSAQTACSGAPQHPVAGRPSRRVFSFDISRRTSRTVPKEP